MVVLKLFDRSNGTFLCDAGGVAITMMLKKKKTQKKKELALALKH